MQYSQGNRCTNCGTEKLDCQSVIVKDWREDYMCHSCFKSFAWPEYDWEFTPPESGFGLPRYIRK